jgi:transcriptional regulator with XRE-family HTH domain
MAKTLRQLAEDAGMGPNELADALGVNRSAVGFWMRGDTAPRSNKLRAIADALGVTVDTLREALQEVKERKAAGERP